VQHEFISEVAAAKMVKVQGRASLFTGGNSPEAYLNLGNHIKDWGLLHGCAPEHQPLFVLKVC
jgi:hypothetical protein